ncbi:hypothetical protein [Paenibacillus campinasensis]|uniref:Uncharacterized protein n=1 Tax=Paenibacillus campinasensis TaxID=66347 RepID=A0A268EKP3_9BACL|nr:hypothetical protein [Paenibacillus campinasensis]PAD73688.1 hypothetical protein CHH67_19835 [Paenibacillus campinasensis]
MDISAKDAAQQLHEILKAVRDNYDQNLEEIAYCDGEYLDLNHALEFFELDQIERLELAKQLQDNRRRRRRAKDENERLQPLYDLVTQKQELVSEVSKGRRMVQNIIRSQATRRYTPRVRIDLQPLFEEARAAANQN